MEGTLEELRRISNCPEGATFSQLGLRKSVESFRDIIRVWGVLNDYRPPGQTSWSRALVRHGAEARAAISAMLGVPAEQIGVRDLDKL
jgi:hypothetical protein